MSPLKTSSRKYKSIYSGPLVVYKIIDTFQYIFMEIESKILNCICNFNRFKQAYLRTKKGPVITLAYLKQIIILGIRINNKSRIV